MNPAIDYFGLGQFDQLGQLPAGSFVTGSDRLQHLSAAGENYVRGKLAGLYFVPLATAPLPPGSQGLRAVSCSDLQRATGAPVTGAGCFPTARDYLAQLPAGTLTLYAGEDVQLNTVDVIVTADPSVAGALAVPGGPNAIFSVAPETAPPGPPPSVARGGGAGAAIAGAVAGGLLGLALGGPGGGVAGAAVGGIGGAVLGNRRA